MRFVLLCGVTWCGLVGAALACEYDVPPNFEISADDQDVEAPPAPDAKVVRVKRGQDTGGDGCSREVTSCDDVGYVLLDLGRGDGGAQSELGYVLEARGTFPPDLARYLGRPVEPLAYDPGHLRLVWSDGEGHENYDFELSVWSVDRAGNMSGTATQLRVANSGSDGCAALSSGARGSWFWSLLLLLFVRRLRSLSIGRTNGPSSI